MKPKSYRRSCKKQYLRCKKLHKDCCLKNPDLRFTSFNAYLRLVYGNMIWEGKVKGNLKRPSYVKMTVYRD